MQQEFMYKVIDLQKMKIVKTNQLSVDKYFYLDNQYLNKKITLIQNSFAQILRKMIMTYNQQKYIIMEFFLQIQNACQQQKIQQNILLNSNNFTFEEIKQILSGDQKSFDELFFQKWFISMNKQTNYVSKFSEYQLKRTKTKQKALSEQYQNQDQSKVQIIQYNNNFQINSNTINSINSNFITTNKDKSTIKKSNQLNINNSTIQPQFNTIKSIESHPHKRFRKSQFHSMKSQIKNKSTLHYARQDLQWNKQYIL